MTVDGVIKNLPVSLLAGPEIHTFIFTAPNHESTKVEVDGMREHRSLVLAMKPAVVPSAEPASGKKLPDRPTAAVKPRSLKKTSVKPLPDAGAAPGNLPEKKTSLITDF